MTKTFVAYSHTSLTDQITRFSEAFDLKPVAEILTIRDGKYIMTVKFV